MLLTDGPARTAGSGAAPAATLLLVDDNPVNLQVLLKTLDGHGYRLLVAKDGRTALDIAQRVRPDMVLLDVLMPGMGGFDVCRALKADPAMRSAPIIFLSALGDVSDKVAGLSLGAVDYVTKPIQPEEVLARVDAHLSRHRLERELRKAYERLDRELEGAAGMQRLILPRVLPGAEGARFAAHYRTCRHAGGDYYYVIPLPDGRYGVLVLDVSGHGAPAAIVMAIMRTLVHTYPGVPDHPESVFRRLHDHFTFLRDTPVYATAVYAVVDPRGRRVHLASAGHPLPLRFRAGCGVTPLDCDSTTPLLLLTEREEVSATEHQLAPGDRLLFYTDGVTDRESPDGDHYDVARLADAFARHGAHPTEGALAGIVYDVETFAQGAEPQDDNTLVMLGVE
jgi:sigma-B regulation protein RsbU (phosphoserine phosphatase)